MHSYRFDLEIFSSSDRVTAASFTEAGAALKCLPKSSFIQTTSMGQGLPET
jgi:hypothetical protein